MILSFDMQNMIYIWLSVAIIAIVIEVITSDLTSIWVSAAAVPSLILAIFVEIWWIQLVVFIVVMVLLIVLLRPVVLRYIKRNEIKTNTDAIVGMQAKVICEIKPDEIGRVKLGGNEWAAVSNEDIQVGENVEVLAIEGVKLIVRKI